MKIRNIAKIGMAWLVLGLGLSIVQPARGQTTNVTIQLGDLEQVYTGGSLVPSVQTVPPGVPVTLQFFPGNYGIYSSNAVGSGMYLVVATPTDTNYSGVSSNFFYIDRAPATIILGNMVQTYNGLLKYFTITTVPSGLLINLTCDGYTLYGYSMTQGTVDSNIGSHSVVATIADYNYIGSTSGTFVIQPAPATITLTNLTQVYDGTPKTPGVVTVPNGLSVTYTYNGSSTPPINAGAYTVVAMSANIDYQGSATNTLVITPPAPAPITLGRSSILSDGTFQLSFTNTPGGSFSVLGSADPTAPVADWTVLGNAVEVSPGQFQFIDMDATNQSLEFYRISSP